MVMPAHDATRPLVSAIVPTRNRAQLLSSAIDSVLAQEGRGTQFELEIIVVDDASSDGTPDVARRYPAVHYVRLDTQRGAAAARNIGIKASNGRYVAFQDDDDLWLPQKLRVQTEALEQHPEVGVVYGQSVIDNGTEQFVWPDASFAPSGSVFRPLLEMCFCVHPPGLLIRRDVFATAGYFDEQLATNEDYDLWLRIAFHFPFLFVPGPVAVYHESPKGLYYSSMARGTGANDARTVVHKGLQMLPGGSQYDAVRREIRLRNELRIAQHRTWYAAHDVRWKEVLAALRAHPQILRYRWGRGAIASYASAQIVHSEAPLATARTLCAQIREAASERGLKPWLWLRLALASVWTEAAIGLGDGRPKRARAAGSAAAWAVVHDPSKLRMRILSWLMLRAVLWPVADAIGTFRRQGLKIGGRAR